MQVFIYEFVTGGGLWQSTGDPSASPLLPEARAIVTALATDFLDVSDMVVQVMRDSRLEPFHSKGCQVSEVDSAEAELALLSYLSSQADWTLLIAPETGGALVQRSRLVEASGKKRLSPPTNYVSIAANKQTTAELLERRKVPVPRGTVLAGGTVLVGGTGLTGGTVPTGAATDIAGIPFPAVLKPVDGCGSQGLRLLAAATELPKNLPAGDWRLEEFVPGMPVSVAVLCGPKEYFVLPTCEQRLSEDGHFQYLGGRLRLPAKLDGRARRLGLAAARAMPPMIGYIGVDLMLGDAADGSGDRVIEINPRLTTSYVGLRALSQSNLAAAMLAIAQGQPADLRFGGEAIEFTADGKIT